MVVGRGAPSARDSPLATVHVHPATAILDRPPATRRPLPPSTPIDRPRSIPFFRARPAGSKGRSDRPRLIQEVSSRKDGVRRAPVHHPYDPGHLKPQKPENLGEVVGGLLEGGAFRIPLAGDDDRLLSRRKAGAEPRIDEGVHPVLHQLELAGEEVEVYRRAEDDGVGLPYILQEAREVVVDLALFGALAVVASLAAGVAHIIRWYFSVSYPASSAPSSTS